MLTMAGSHNQAGGGLLSAVHALAHVSGVAATEQVILMQALTLLDAEGAMLLCLAQDGRAVERTAHQRAPDAIVDAWLPGKPTPNGTVQQAVTRGLPARGGGALGDGLPQPDVSLPLLDEGRPRAVVCVFGARAAASWSDDALLGLAELMSLALMRARGGAGVDAQERLEELQAQVGGVMGHDLRNPLAAVMISAGVLLRAKELEGKHTDTLLRMMSSATRMKAMLSDVVDYVQLRSGGSLPLLPSEGDVAPELRRAVADAERTAGRAFRWQIPAHLVVNLDPDRLVQVLTVLLSNAFSHGAKDTPVTLVVATEGKDLRVDVTNEGPPIPPEIRKQLYLPRRKGKTAGTRGLGLGLYLAREIARAHGGSLQETSETSGTVFTLRLSGVVV